MSLPGIDGWEVARRLREQADGVWPLLVAVTEYDRSEGRQQSAETGIGVHLLKPMHRADLERLLAKWVAHLAPDPRNSRSTACLPIRIIPIPRPCWKHCRNAAKTNCA